MPIEHVTQALEGHTAHSKLIATYRDYYEGRHQLRYATKDFDQRYGDVVRSLRENLIPGIVSAYADKTHVETWTADDTQLASEAIEGLDRLHARVTREKYLTGSAFVLVWPGPNGDPQPHFHTAQQIIPTVDPTNPAVLQHAVKLIFDPNERLPRANIYYPDRVERWALKRDPLPKEEQPAWDDYRKPDKWAPYDLDGDPDVIPHQFGAVPIIWDKHDDTGPTSWGRSVIADAIPLQDALNTFVAQTVVLGEGYARPFWYLLNYSPGADGKYAPDDAFAKALAHAQQQANDKAEKQAEFDRGKQSIFATDSPGPFGQLDPPNLTHLMEVQEKIAEKIARVTGIPTFYLSQSPSDVPSGEALRKLQVRLDTSIRTSNKESAAVWRGLKQLLGLDDAPPVFADPNPTTKTERINEALAMKQLGYPLEDCLRHVEQTSDVDALMQRVREAEQSSAEALGRSLAAGRIPPTY